MQRRMVRINWYVTLDQDRCLQLLSRDGRSKSEHVRNAIEKYKREGGDVSEQAGFLVKRNFNITAEQLAFIAAEAQQWGVDRSTVLRAILQKLINEMGDNDGELGTN